MGEPANEVETAEPGADAEAPEGAVEEGTVEQDAQGGTALAREEEEDFDSDPEVEVEGDDLEAARVRAADTITRAVPGRANGTQIADGSQRAKRAARIPIQHGSLSN